MKFVPDPSAADPFPKRAADYLAGYPVVLVEQVRKRIEQGVLSAMLLQKYPNVHEVRTDKALYDYVLKIKERYLRNAGPLGKVAFDARLPVLHHALGMHIRKSRVQGAKLKARREIRVASLFKAMPPEFLRMIVVHELAHIKEREHNPSFYQLCLHMEPDYHQLEFDLRAYLVYLEAAGQPLWPGRADPAASISESSRQSAGNADASQNRGRDQW